MFFALAISLSGYLLLRMTLAAMFTTRRIADTGPWDTCPTCSYDLSGLDDEAACPECGLMKARHAEVLRYASNDSWSRGLRLFRHSIFGGVCVIMLYGALAQIPYLAGPIWDHLVATYPPQGSFHHRNHVRNTATDSSEGLPALLAFAGVLAAWRQALFMAVAIGLLSGVIGGLSIALSTAYITNGRIGSSESIAVAQLIGGSVGAAAGVLAWTTATRMLRARRHHQAV